MRRLIYCSLLSILCGLTVACAGRSTYGPPSISVGYSTPTNQKGIDKLYRTSPTVDLNLTWYPK